MSRIKECFTTRFENGSIVNADFSQLEVVGLAILSLDQQLIADIRSGMDMHIVRAAKLFNITEDKVTKQQRQLAKMLSFQLQYGSGARNMAEQNKIHINVAKKFIEQYYERYTDVKRWQEHVRESVVSSRRVDGHTKGGYPRGTGTYRSPSGRAYSFYEYDPMGGWQKEASFSPTEMKNYPCQGFSTGDVMALYRGQVMRQLMPEMFTNILFINSVHDSVMFDCRDEESVAKCVEVLYNMCKELPTLLTKRFGIKVPLEFNIDVETGPSWANLTKRI
jgi:DNA polymerase I-like protein with 3'-5' exonuclease and polymerase domains